MEDLTDAQLAELDAVVWEFVQDRKFDGLQVVVLLKGRGIRKVCYPQEDAKDAPGLLALAYRDAKAVMDDRNDSRTN